MDNSLPLPRRNQRLLALALVSIAAGYGCLCLPPADGPTSLTVGPLLLVLGYGVLLPLALLIGYPAAKSCRAPEPLPWTPTS